MPIQVPPDLNFDDFITEAFLDAVRNSLIHLDPASRSALVGQVLKVNSTLDGFDFGRLGMKKTIGGGLFMIPAGPAKGTGVQASGSTANTYGSWVELIAATSAALYIVGVLAVIESGSGGAYIQLDIGVGAAAAESSVGEVKFHRSSQPLASGPPFTSAPLMLATPIAVASGARIACRHASDQLSTGADVTLLCVNAADLEDF